MKRRSLIHLLLASGLTGAAARARAIQPRGFAFGLIGDIPYNALEALALEDIFAQLDPDLRFLIHAGDLKRSASACSDTLLASRHRLLDAAPLPLIYVPGDNEWVDCSKASQPSDPYDRLDALRRLFFSRPESIGRRRMPVSQQSAFGERGPSPPDGLPENLRWRVDDVLFVTLNIQGSLDGIAAGLPENRRSARRRADLRWLREGFAMARRDALAAIVIVCHADPRFGRDIPADGRRPNDPHLPYRIALRDEVGAFDGSVLFLHGDSHRFTSDYPFRAMVNPGWGDASSRRRLHAMQRVECFGSPYSGNWVRIEYRAGRDPAFSVIAKPVDGADYLIG